MTIEPTSAHRRAIRLWLYAVAGLVFLMVMVGGPSGRRIAQAGAAVLMISTAIWSMVAM